MNDKQKPKNYLVERALDALKKEYIVIGKTHVRSWDAWLVIGLMVGLAAGVLFVANRSGEFEAGKATPPPPEFSDNFNRPNSSVLENGWQEVQGGFLIDANELRNARTDDNGRKISTYSIAIQPSLGGVVQAASADFVLASRDAQPRFGIVLRYQDPQNYYLIYRESGDKDEARISKIAGGKEFILQAASTSRLASLASFHLEGRAENDAITLLLDGKLLLTVSDSTFSEGALGILLGAQKDISHRADNFSTAFGALPPPPPTVQSSPLITSPNGGEAWIMGTKHSIRWTTAGSAKTSFVDILLCVENGCSEKSYAIASNISNDGTFTWNVGATTDSSVVSEGEYLIRIRRNDTGEFDESDKVFSILEKGTKPAPRADCGGSVPCSCGDRVVTNTVLDLAKDPVVSTSGTDVCSGDGLIVASGVTLDLGGTTLRGRHAGGVGILAENGASDMTITNGTIDGFHDGIKITDAARNIITKITAIRNRYFGILIGGSPQVSVDNRIEDSAAIENGGRGMRIRGHRAVLLRNRAERNGGYGFNIRADNAVIQQNIGIDNKSACIHADGSSMLIEANECYRNGWQGIGSDESHNGIVRNNILRGNIGPGLWLVGNNNLVVTDNVSTDNIGEGILMIGNGNTLERNQVYGNKQIGLDVRGGNNYIKANTASNNKSKGIEAKPKSRGDINNDGGENIANGNGKVPQCVIDGVACR